MQIYSRNERRLIRYWLRLVRTASPGSQHETNANAIGLHLAAPAVDRRLERGAVPAGRHHPGAVRHG